MNFWITMQHFANSMLHSLQIMDCHASVIDLAHSAVLLTKKRKLSVQDVPLPKNVSVINHCTICFFS